jgi:hypothetical protein
MPLNEGRPRQVRAKAGQPRSRPGAHWLICLARARGRHHSGVRTSRGSRRFPPGRLHQPHRAAGRAGGAAGKGADTQLV